MRRNALFAWVVVLVAPGLRVATFDECLRIADDFAETADMLRRSTQIENVRIFEFRSRILIGFFIDFFEIGFFIELTNATKISNKLSSVDNAPSHHSGAQGRDFAGRERSGGSGAVAAAAFSKLKSTAGERL